VAQVSICGRCGETRSFKSNLIGKKKKVCRKGVCQRVVKSQNGKVDKLGPFAALRDHFTAICHLFKKSKKSQMESCAKYGCLNVCSLDYL
jgi:hypothetical protein